MTTCGGLEAGDSTYGRLEAGDYTCDGLEAGELTMCEFTPEGVTDLMHKLTKTHSNMTILTYHQRC